jgi:murein DD-endopeptidase MepM/ murein hydrolase activator NlpD
VDVDETEAIAPARNADDDARERSARAEPSEGPLTFAMFGVVAAAIAWGGIWALGASSHKTTETDEATVASAVVAAAASSTVPDVASASISIAPVARVVDSSANVRDDGPPKPPTWRVATLASDSSIEIVKDAIGHHAMLSAIAAAHVAKGEARRLLAAFDGVRRFDRCGAHDTFAIAKDKKSGRIVAFEYATSKSDVWQAREEDGVLRGKKLELDVQHKRVAAFVPVTDDLRASVVRAGFDESVLKLVDDAIDGHAELADVRSGARLRILVDEERIDGVHADDELEAVEYIPAKADANTTPLRVYRFVPSRASKSTHANATYYDAKGQRPTHGGWRSPIPFARVTSRFNPHRMHPILHTVMPHNGVDFAASTGTPVYASASGTVRSVGDSGPCGNMVQLTHANGLVTAYCHLSRFASGLHEGMRVEARQLVGYVGQTGRATGPHLHFAVKRGDVFLDPLALKLDGVRVVPSEDRAAFEKEREDFDAALDAIAMPFANATPAANSPDAGHAAPSVDEGANDETMYDEPQ